MDQLEYLESLGLELTGEFHYCGTNMIFINNILFFFNHPGISYIIFDETGTVFDKHEDFDSDDTGSWKGLTFRDFIIGVRYVL